MNKRFFILPVLCALWLLPACRQHSDKEATAHHSDEQDATSEEETEHIAGLSPEQIKAAGITLGSVVYKELTATIKANGMLRVPNHNQANATALYGGVVKSLYIQIGTHVRKGQAIATITNPQFIQLQEEYLTLKDKLTLAEQELQRQEELYAGNAGAGKNLQSARAALQTLRTRRASLQQQIRLMGINPSGLSADKMQTVLTVHSPISGTVSEVFARIGSYVDVATPIAAIVDNGSLHLDLQVFEKDLPQLKVGQVIHFTLTNNPTTEYDARVFSIGSSFENDSKTIAVHCDVTGNKTGLIDGMNITGLVSLNNVTAPAVPNEAIVSADGKDYIFVRRSGPQPTNATHDHVHEAGEEHDHEQETDPSVSAKQYFEKIEVFKGVSDMGYTAVTLVQDIPDTAQIVTKGAFFINAKLSNTGGHEH